MDLGLAGRVYVVTGGARGLGRATAEVLVDGISVGTIDTQDKGSAHVWDVPVTAGDRTIAVRASSGSVYVQGIHVYDGDETAGLQIIDASHHGWAWQAETTLSSQSQAAALAALKVDGVVTALGDGYLLGYAKEHDDVIARDGRFEHLLIQRDDGVIPHRLGSRSVGRIVDDDQRDGGGHPAHLGG